MDELKACPFCGSSNIQPAPLSDYEWYRCNDCDALSGRGGAIGWNSRPLEDALQAEIARLRKKVERARVLFGLERAARLAVEERLNALRSQYDIWRELNPDNDNDKEAEGN